MENKRQQVSCISNCNNNQEKRISIELLIAGKKVLFENVKALICEDCGEAYIDGKTVLNVEKTQSK